MTSGLNRFIFLFFWG